WKVGGKLPSSATHDTRYTACPYFIQETLFSRATATKRPLLEEDSDDDTTDDSPLHTIKSASKPAIETPSTASKPRYNSTVTALAAEKRPSETELKNSSKKQRKEKLGSGKWGRPSELTMNVESSSSQAPNFLATVAES
ncbi:hypothetical protein SOVF_130350, partial [Spinacia oleracea]